MMASVHASVTAAGLAAVSQRAGFARAAAGMAWVVAVWAWVAPAPPRNDRRDGYGGHEHATRRGHTESQGEKTGGAALKPRAAPGSGVLEIGPQTQACTVRDLNARNSDTRRASRLGEP